MGDFFREHASDIWACDFTVAYDWLFRRFTIFVVMKLHTRQVVHVAVSDSPTDRWTALQLRKATPWNQGPKYLIRDRDSKYGPRFSAVASTSGIQELKTPFRTPKAKAICERFMGSLRRECLDHTLIFHRRHLQQGVAEYVAYYNHDRPHQGIRQQIPDHSDQLQINPSGKIITRLVLGGLHHTYSRVAPLIPSG